MAYRIVANGNIMTWLASLAAAACVCLCLCLKGVIISTIKQAAEWQCDSIKMKMAKLYGGGEAKMSWRSAAWRNIIISTSGVWRRGVYDSIMACSKAAKVTQSGGSVMAKIYPAAAARKQWHQRHRRKKNNIIIAAGERGNNERAISSKKRRVTACSIVCGAP